MKLSIVTICWNDLGVIKDCLASIYTATETLDFEVIVSDNGSTDGSLSYIREHFPQVRIVENGTNLGFARGNNAGIRVATGEYVLILNPDTIIRERALENLVAYADLYPKAGAFGCRVLNPDGSFQDPARPIPTLLGSLVDALYMRWLACLSDVFLSGRYVGWNGETEREIGRQSGCCVLFRKTVLDQLSGFDPRFFYHFEEADLCLRTWKLGYSIRFCPGAEIVHLGGQSVGRFPVRFKLETYRSQYRYFHKHYGLKGLAWTRRISLLHLFIRWVGYGLIRFVKPGEALDKRLAMYRVLLAWNYRVTPIRFIEKGEEPDLGYEPLTPAPTTVTSESSSQ